MKERTKLMEQKAIVKETEMKDNGFGRVLVVGLGSTAGTLIPLAQPYTSEVVCVTRDSDNGRQTQQELEASDGKIVSQGLINAEGKVDRFYLGWEALSQETFPPDTVFLCTPNQDYAENIHNLSRLGLLKEGQTIVGISTRVGSGNEILMAIKDEGCDPDSFNVVSVSTYYAATKPVPPSRTTVSTRAVKNRIFLGVSNPENPRNNVICQMLSQIGTKAEIVDGNLGAELQNANTFVHAQLTSSPEALKDIYSPSSERDYIYRPEPEGCLSKERCMVMAKSEEEINRVFRAMNYPEVNLLDMLNNDLYPVPELSVHGVVQSYPTLSTEQKAELLYKWFYGRQTDPETGKDHLKAVKLQRLTWNGEVYVLPRIPGEDYSALLLITTLAGKLNVETPALDKIISDFEEQLVKFGKETNFNLDQKHSEMRKMADITLNRI